MLRRQYTPSLGMYVMNLGVEVPEDGVYDVGTYRSEVKVYICMKSALFGFMNSYFEQLLA